jgi:hypothetical protein
MTCYVPVKSPLVSNPSCCSAVINAVGVRSGVVALFIPYMYFIPSVQVHIFNV